MRDKNFPHFQRGEPLMLADFQSLNVQILIDFDQQISMEGQTHLNVEIVVSIDVQTSKILYGNKF